MNELRQSGKPGSRKPSLVRSAVGGWVGVVLALFACALLTACRYPDDPNGTLERVSSGTLRVGVTENPPWVVRLGEGAAAGATGVEPALLQTLASELSSEIRWYWGNESELLAALEAGQLDVAIGGFREADPIKAVVGFTRPYFTAPITVGSRDGEAPPASLEGVSVAVAPLTPHVEALRDRGARPVETDDLASAALVAAPLWWLHAHGYTAASQKLGEERFRMAVARGENAWLLRLQGHLDSQPDLHARVVVAERAGAGR